MTRLGCRPITDTRLVNASHSRYHAVSVKASRARGRAPGLNPRSYPKAVRDCVAIDYEHRLAEGEARWLARFNSAVHSGDFRGWSQHDFTTEARREIWRELKRAQAAWKAEQGLDMAKPKASSVSPSTSAGLNTDEGEPITLVGLAKTPKGYVAVSVVVQGNRVLKQQAHCVPQRREYAALALKQALFSKVLFPQASVLNVDNEGDDE